MRRGRKRYGEPLKMKFLAFGEGDKKVAPVLS